MAGAQWLGHTLAAWSRRVRPSPIDSNPAEAHNPTYGHEAALSLFSEIRARTQVVGGVREISNFRPTA